jgi:DNA-binding response OmpR family regulator
MATLLLVGDDPQVREAIARHPQANAWTVLTASTARQALELLRQPPDVVLLDPQLADLPGWQFYDSLRHIDPRIPVILLTPVVG